MFIGMFKEFVEALASDKGVYRTFGFGDKNIRVEFIDPDNGSTIYGFYVSTDSNSNEYIKCANIVREFDKCYKEHYEKKEKLKTRYEYKLNNPESLYPKAGVDVYKQYVENDIHITKAVEEYVESCMKCVMNSYFGASMYKTTVNLSMPHIKDVIFNAPATIVFWSDGTKTVVKCQDGDYYDPEKGLAMAISKKTFGNQRDYYHEFLKWLKKYNKEVDKATEEFKSSGLNKIFNMFDE